MGGKTVQIPFVVICLQLMSSPIHLDLNLSSLFCPMCSVLFPQPFLLSLRLIVFLLFRCSPIPSLCLFFYYSFRGHPNPGNPDNSSIKKTNSSETGVISFPITSARHLLDCAFCFQDITLQFQCCPFLFPMLITMSLTLGKIPIFPSFLDYIPSERLLCH